jgi:putative phosphonate metabolism protein
MHDVSVSTSRYALYFSPGEDTSLAQLGGNWLGRDTTTDKSALPQLPEEIISSEWFRVTESARRYGFHATLKPPFKLAEGTSVNDLRLALRSFATRKVSFLAPHLIVGRVGHFLALILSESSRALCDLADDCVRDFDHFRAPATDAEMNRRTQDSMTARELENLLRWGYPYVFDTWKFHMTLTCSLESDLLAVFHRHLQERFREGCNHPLRIDSICLYEEPAAGMPFRLLERFAFGL